MGIEYIEARLVSPVTDKQLERKAAKGCRKSQKQLVLQNMDRVLCLARHFKARLGTKMDIDDLAGAGMVGLVRASREFTLKLLRKGGFIRFANYHIRNHMVQAINESHILRYPHYFLSGKRRLNKADGEKRVGKSKLRELNITEAGAKRMRQEFPAEVSIHAPANGHENEEPIAIEDTSAENPADQMEQKDLHQILMQAMKRLPTRNRLMIEHRFGLNGAKEMSGRELSRKCKMTFQRVSQIQMDTIEKLRRYLAR